VNNIPATLWTGHGFARCCLRWPLSTQQLWNSTITRLYQTRPLSNVSGHTERAMRRARSVTESTTGGTGPGVADAGRHWCSGGSLRVEWFLLTLTQENPRNSAFQGQNMNVVG
jgi:hypothetical protein